MGATTSKTTTQEDEDVVLGWRLAEAERKASDRIQALERENAQLKQEVPP